MKHDRLKLPRLLESLDAEYSRGEMGDAAELVPVLRTIAGDPGYLRMAQRKAQSLLERIRDGRPTLEFEKALLYPQQLYWSVRVRDDGQARYAHASGAADDSSLAAAAGESSPATSPTFSLSAATVQQLFSLAAQMKNFRGATSEKTRPGIPVLMEIGLAYEKGPVRYRVAYVSSPGGKTGRMVKLFEGIANQRWHAANLTRAMASPESSRRIELWHVLTVLEKDLKKSQVVEPEVLAPLLREIAGSGRIAPEEAGLARRLLQWLGGPTAAGEAERRDGQGDRR